MSKASLTVDDTYHANYRVNYAFINPVRFHLGQWLREVCVSFVQRLRTQTQAVYTVFGNLMHFRYVLLYKIIPFKYFSDLKV